MVRYGNIFGNIILKHITNIPKAYKIVEQEGLNAQLIVIGTKDLKLQLFSQFPYFSFINAYFPGHISEGRI